MQNSPNDNTNTISVDIRLCGNIPRNEMKAHFGAPYPTTDLTSQPSYLSTACLAETNGPTLHKIRRCSDEALEGLTIQKTINMLNVLSSEKQQLPLTPILEPPTWAVPASVESTLQPVCESLGRQASIDLTTKSAFRIGRSPNCDVQLIHATSSRRHAMVFHHSNGSCYIVDCGSAHGTFVNGRRIACPAVSGVVVPHKIRRGSIVRFGGPGAPCFILKSLPTHLNNINLVDSTLSEKALSTLRNTRLNALGKPLSEVMVSSNVTNVSNQLPCIISNKRSFESLSSHDSTEFDDSSFDESCNKRARCSSPLLAPEEPLRLVSPDLPAMAKPRRVTFAVEDAYYYPAPITPDESSDEDEVSV